MDPVAVKRQEHLLAAVILHGIVSDAFLYRDDLLALHGKVDIQI